MKKEKILGLGTLALAGVVGFTGCSVSNEDGKAWAEQHGYVKAGDYNIDVENDAGSGASTGTETLENQMSQAEIKQLILDQLRGFVLYWYKDVDGQKQIEVPEYETNVYPYTQSKEQIERMEAEGWTAVYSYREMYQIATAYNNVPNISSVEYVIDTGTMKIYGTSEKGTQKVEDIVTNPNVSLYWTKQVAEEDYFAASADTNDYWRSYGVQIIGTARIIDGTTETELYNKIADMYMQTMRGYAGWNLAYTQDQRTALLERLKTINTWYEITPTQINSHSLWNMYNKDNVCSTAEIVDGKVVTTVQTCPSTGNLTPTETVIKGIFAAAPNLYEGWHVNETAVLVDDQIVWTKTASAGSLYKWSGGLQKKWAKALFGKSYRQVLTDFDVTPVYPEAVTDKNA